MKPQVVIAPIVLAGLLTAGYFIDRSRSAQESLLSGSFENQPSLAASRIGGRVERILVKEGDTVKKGQPLLELENVAYAESVRSQHAAAGLAEQELKEQAKGPRPEDIAKQRASVQEADEPVRSGDAQAAVLLRPPTVTQISEWAHERRRMPPKTSYFSPKPRTGMVFRPL